MVEVSTIGSPSKTDNSKDGARARPVWKTVVRAVLIIVIIGAAILAAKYFAPAVVNMVAKAGTAVAAAAGTAAAVADTVSEAAGLGTAAAQTVGHTIKHFKNFVNFVDKWGNNSLVVTGAQAIQTTVENFLDGATITTSSGDSVTNPGWVLKWLINPWKKITGGK